jgi:hypothetical protein
VSGQKHQCTGSQGGLIFVVVGIHVANRATETDLPYRLAKEHIEESPVSGAIPSGRKPDFGSEVRVCGIVRLERFKHEVW